jgi:hypothetical protein
MVVESATDRNHWGGYTARRVNMYAVGDGFRAGSNTLIEDSWVHDLGHDGAHDPSPHIDAVQSIGGSNITIRNNRLEGQYRQQTSSIIMSPYTGLLSNVADREQQAVRWHVHLVRAPPRRGNMGRGGVRAVRPGPSDHGQEQHVREALGGIRAPQRFQVADEAAAVSGVRRQRVRHRWGCLPRHARWLLPVMAPSQDPKCEAARTRRKRMKDLSRVFPNLHEMRVLDL